jgi:long-chain acyl-CoA synthetase
MTQYNTIPQLISYVLESYRNPKAFNYLENNQWRSFSTEQFLEIIRKVALGLFSLGIKKGDCVGILASSSPYWLIADFAIQMIGGVSVPLFPHISSVNFRYQVDHSQMKALFVMGKQVWYSYQKKFSVSGVKVITYDISEGEKGEFSWEKLIKEGDRVSEQDPRLFLSFRDKVDPYDVATIIYTSGTTSMPKGVKLSHFNIISQVHGAEYRFPLDSKTDRALSVLPLAHIFERMLVYYYISGGINIYFADSIGRIGALFKEVKPTICAIVPRVLEKIYTKMYASLESKKGVKRCIGDWAFALAGDRKTSFFNKVQKRVADRLVYSKVQKIFGGKLKALVVGGAPLPKYLCCFFLDLGVPIYQGYGLTETSPVISTNYNKHNKPGSVGLPYPGVQVKISEDNEILAQGPNLMQGYLGDVESDVYIDEEGWLHTGDKGYLDSEGYLIIEGRSRDIYKTSSGKYLSPVPIEQALSLESIVEIALVVGEGKKFATCLIFPDLNVLETLNTTDKAIEEFIEMPEFKSVVKGVLAKVNETFNEWEHIKKYYIILEPLSVEGGEITPTLKVKRSVVMEKYKDEISQMYGEKR